MLTLLNMLDTKNTLPPSHREKIIDLLQDRLSDSIDLLLQTKQAHWNVKGPQFIALHELFDDIHKDVRDFVDQVAERIMQLGGSAEGTLQATVHRSHLPTYSLDIMQDLDHAEALSNSLAFYGKCIREDVSVLEKLEDPGTVDLFVKILRKTDKDLWFVESHLFEQRRVESISQIAS